MFRIRRKEEKWGIQKFAALENKARLYLFKKYHYFA